MTHDQLLASIGAPLGDRIRPRIYDGLLDIGLDDFQLMSIASVLAAAYPTSDPWSCLSDVPDASLAELHHICVAQYERSEH